MTWTLRAGVVAAGVLALAGAEARAVDKAAVTKAVDKGVAALRKLQKADGTWEYSQIGPTALAGLTLLECGAPATDKAVQKAAAAVRKASVDLTFTYSLALAILFLDRLDEPADTALIESMTARLLNGQTAAGTWSYSCPTVPEAEALRLKAHLAKTAEPKGRAALPKLPAKGKRTVKDLPKEVVAALPAKRAAAPDAARSGDNSNTQFATLALWAGRRYGLPVHDALLLVDAHYRATQLADGGWAYNSALPAATSTGPMTCAGILGLAAAHGSADDLARARDPKAAARDVSADKRLTAALKLLATGVGMPVGGAKGGAVPKASGKAYYYLWSLERVAVLLGLEKIHGRDWYAWGAEVLVANQAADGTWGGEYAVAGVDTCFALLFLRRSNLTADLTGRLAGVAGGERVLKAGPLVGVTALKPAGIGEKPGPKEAKKPTETSSTPRAESPAARLGRDLEKATGVRRTALLAKLREGKGVAYTEALAGAIPRMDADGRRLAREALAERLGRMTAKTLRNYFKDEDAELRRAAALACALKEDKSLVPDLKKLLKDPEPLVARAARAALKELTGKED